MIRRNKCLLCSRELAPVEGSLEFLQSHPNVEDCEVIYTDAWGVAVEVVEPEPEEPTPIAQTIAAPTDEIDLYLVNPLYPTVEECITAIFASYGLERQGGASSGRGWTSVATFQRCWYLWKQRYLSDERPQIQTSLAVEHPSRAIGTVVHAFLALYYSHMIEGSPFLAIPIDAFKTQLLNTANPAIVAEGWRVFSAYRLWYQLEPITPLAIEHDLRDPRTGESCRYDLIAWFEGSPEHGLLPGTYNVEHKTAGRFDHATLEGWQNDGEVIGQNALWQRLGLDRRFGPLRGTIVNLLGKQKEPKFHRTFVAPDSFRIQSHLDDLRRWEGLISLAKSANNFPRSRGNCINRWGMCDLYEHCAANDDC